MITLALTLPEFCGLLFAALTVLVWGCITFHRGL